MIGFLIDKIHFSFDNLKRICNGKLADSLVDRTDCFQCKVIMSELCMHNQYYCVQCNSKWIVYDKTEYSRSCWRHMKFIDYNEFFKIHKACLKCYRKMCKEFTDRNLLPPSAELYLTSATMLNASLNFEQANDDTRSPLE
jgi:hypothetical protein